MFCVLAKCQLGVKRRDFKVRAFSSIWTRYAVPRMAIRCQDVGLKLEIMNKRFFTWKKGVSSSTVELKKSGTPKSTF